MDGYWVPTNPHITAYKRIFWHLPLAPTNLIKCIVQYWSETFEVTASPKFKFDGWWQLRWQSYQVSSSVSIGGKPLVSRAVAALSPTKGKSRSWVTTQLNGRKELKDWAVLSQKLNNRHLLFPIVVCNCLPRDRAGLATDGQRRKTPGSSFQGLSVLKMRPTGNTEVF